MKSARLLIRPIWEDADTDRKIINEPGVAFSAELTKQRLCRGPDKT